MPRECQTCATDCKNKLHSKMHACGQCECGECCQNPKCQAFMLLSLAENSLPTKIGTGAEAKSGQP